MESQARNQLSMGDKRDKLFGMGSKLLHAMGACYFCRMGKGGDQELTDTWRVERSAWETSVRVTNAVGWVVTMVEGESA